MSDVLPFVETFGPTLQGEGAAAGRLSSFLRFGGCNLSCSWCDSPYTWDADRFDLRREISLLTVQEIVARVPAAPLLIITGGEPLLNQKKPAFVELLQHYKDAGVELHMETNGTLVPNRDMVRLIDQFSVSPKLAHAGEHKRTQNRALAPGWLRVHDQTPAHLKVVCETAADVRETREMAEKHGWPLDRVWVMPEGTTSEVLNARWPEIATAATEQGINASHRLHVLAWTDARGH
ncbi:7-carboxy-7-deazaguanine synthase QueE [Arthrobacter sulfonylureivorans]|uniref:7-carboxy-7-deazaguanine synthase QueE n=1 Tax=Arthrobacter sulfonylureivorans TaxID=2486855 RepID=UPI0039E5932B